jgi:hypothetical protein
MSNDAYLEQLRRDLARLRAPTTRRMHVEAAGRAARRGNGVWRHGLWSFEAIELRRKATVEMRGLRPLMRALREEQRRVLRMVK